jgi:hypothetical protein
VAALATLAMALLLASVGVSGPAQAAPARTVTLTGSFVEVHGDSKYADQTFYYLHAGDRYYRLRTAGELTVRPRSTIEVHGQLTGDTIDLRASGSVRTSAAAAATSTALGQKSVLAINVVWPGATLTATPAQQRSFLFGSDSRSVAQYYSDASYGQMTWTGGVTPSYTITDPATCDLFSLANQADAAAAAGGYDLDSYDALMINAPNLHCGSAGYGEIGGKHSWIENGLWNLGDGYARLVPTHEIGHQLGLYHSHGLECGTVTITSACLDDATGHNEEYGNAYDVMGNNWPGDDADGVTWFSAKQEMILGWLSGSRVRNVASSGTYPLVPLEKKGTSQPQVLVITAGSHTYYVEYRQPISQDSFLTAYPAATNSVHINVSTALGGDTGPFALDFSPGSTKGGYYDWYDAPLAVGKSFTEPGKAFTISPLSQNGTTAAVKVTFAETPTVTAKSPAAGATGVAVGSTTARTPVTAGFGAAVAGVNTSSFTLRRGSTAVPATVSYDATTHKATLLPRKPLVKDTRYTASLSSSITSTGGRPLAPLSWTFTTGPRPVVTTTQPASRATGVRRKANITATFSEAVTGIPTKAAATPNVTLTRTSTGATFRSVAGYQKKTRKVTLNPTGTLRARTTYTVTLRSGIKDTAGNPLTTKAWTFTTGRR